MMRARRWILTTLCAALAASMTGCMDNTAFYSLGFSMGAHPKLQTLSFGTYQQKRVVFDDHDIYAHTEHRREGKLSDFDRTHADDVEAGTITFPLMVALQLAELKREGAAPLSEAKLVSVHAVQQGERITCKPRKHTKSMGESSAFEADSGKQPHPPGAWTKRRTKRLTYSCDVTFQPFELEVRYHLERDDASKSIKTVTLPFEPGKFQYRQFNATVARCMSV